MKSKLIVPRGQGWPLQTLRNRTAGRLRTTESQKNVARDCAFPVLRDLFRHSAVLRLSAVILRKVSIYNAIHVQY